MIKKILLGIGAVLFLLIAAIVVLPFVIDVNRFKDPIIQKVEENINGKVALDRIGLKLFPFIGLRLENLAVRNLPDSPFGETPLLKLGTFDFRLHLMPLLQKKVVASLLLKAPEIQFIKTAAGSNVDLLIKKKVAAPAEPPAAEEKKPEAAKPMPPWIEEVRIEKIKIEEGHLVYDDQTNPDAPLAVGGFRLEVTNAVLTDTTKPIGIDLGMRLFDAANENLSFKADVAVDQAKKNATVKDAKLVIAGSPILFNVSVEDYEKNRKVDATLSAPAFQMNSVYSLLPQSKKSLPPDSSLEGSLALSLSANGTPEAIALKTSLDLKQANIKYGDTFVKPAGATLDLSIEGNYATSGVNISQFAFHILSGVITGSGSLAMSGGQDLKLDLQTNPLNLKELLTLSPGNKEMDVEGSLQLTFKAAGSPLKPDEMNLAGSLSSESIRYTTYALTGLTSAFSYEKKVAHLNELKFTLFEGLFSGTGSVDLNPQKPVWDFALTVDGINIDTALTQFAGQKDTLTGKGNLALALKGTGTTPPDIKQSLSGTIDIALRDGEIKAINIAPGIFSETMLGGMNLVAEKFPDLSVGGLKLSTPGFVQGLKGTPYHELKGNAKIENGLIQFPNISLAHSESSIEMGGTVNLDLKLDLKGKYYLSKAATDGWIGNEKMRRHLADKEGRFIVPFAITGDLKNPSVGPDGDYLTEIMKNALTAYVKEELKGKAEAEAKKLAEQAKQKALEQAKPVVEEKAKEVIEQIKPADIGEKLKKLF
ncbi:MAG: AsmA family protein [Deltaproteobacteria bacterium]|nr:AsmA family protein [Deltaproteobacteria bacterium]